MKKLLLPTSLLISMVLAGCSSEESIDGTNTDTLKASWQEMYAQVPEVERSQFIQGSGLLVLDSAEDIYLSLDRMDTWHSTSYIDLSTDIIHRDEHGDNIRIAIAEGFDGKTKSDILKFAENTDIELGNQEWIAENAVEDFLN